MTKAMYNKVEQAVKDFRDRFSHRYVNNWKFRYYGEYYRIEENEIEFRIYLISPNGINETLIEIITKESTTMKVKSPAEIIKALRIDFTRVWEYEPSFEILTEEIEYKIDQINKRALLLYRERERITEPERKQLYTDLILEEGDKLGAYLGALDLVKAGKYE